MAFTPIPAGTEPWDDDVNGAFSDQDMRITENENDIGSLEARVTTTEARLDLISDFQPDDNGVASWTIDPAIASGSVATTSGAIALGMFVLRKPAMLNTIFAGETTAPTTSTAGYLGVYNSAGTLMAATTNQAATWDAGTGPRAVPVITPVSLSAGRYWVGLLINAASTGTWLRGAGGGSNWANTAMPGTQRFGNFGAGLSALPSSIDTSLITASNNSFTFGVA